MAFTKALVYQATCKGVKQDWQSTKWSQCGPWESTIIRGYKVSRVTFFLFCQSIVNKREEAQNNKHKGAVRRGRKCRVH